jgi:hypothetical protein
MNGKFGMVAPASRFHFLPHPPQGSGDGNGNAKHMHNIDVVGKVTYA